MSEIVGVVVVALVLAALVAFGMWVGWRSAHEELEEQEAELQAGWDALHRTQRVNAAFWKARQALRAEARRHSRPNQQ